MKFKIVFTLIGVITVFLVPFLIYKNTRIKKIIIISKTSGVKGLTQFNNLNLLFLNEQSLVSDLYRNNLYLKNVTSRKIFPRTLILNLVWRSPIAKVYANNSVIFIDDAGFPSLPLQNIDGYLPDIRLNKLILSSQTADWRLKKIVTLIDKLNNFNLHFSGINVNGNSSEITGLIDNSIQIIIPLEADPQEISASLQTIISRFRIEGKFISSIDFRNKNPVVILKNE